MEKYEIKGKNTTAFAADLFAEKGLRIRHPDTIPNAPATPVCKGVGELLFYRFNGWIRCGDSPWFGGNVANLVQAVHDKQKEKLTWVA